MSTRRALGVIAAAVAVLGFVLLLWPVSAAGGVNCGSALIPDTWGVTVSQYGADIRDAYAGGNGSGVDDLQAACDDRLSSQRTIGLVVLVAGGAPLLFLGLTRKPATEDESADAQTPPAPH